MSEKLLTSELYSDNYLVINNLLFFIVNYLHMVDGN